MRLSIIGNCQKDSLAVCVSALNQGFQIETYMIHEIMADAAQLRSVLQESDFIFAQPSLRAADLNGFAHKIRYFPSVAFSAYHPDLTFVRGRKGGSEEFFPVFGPLHIYSSAIAVHGFKTGMPLEEVAALYNADTYSRLGYFDQWDEARRQLLAEGDTCGMPLGAWIDRWSKGQAFLYSSNHPKLAFMEEIARHLLWQIGMFCHEGSTYELLHDPLKAQPIWPVYPEIARRFGFRGSMAFKVNDPHGALELRDFLRYSYEAYSQFDRDSLESLNVDISDFSAKLAPLGGFSSKGGSSNPYAGLDKVQFWKNSVASIPASDLDPVVAPRFKIEREDKVATAGSCFAQHIARTLKGSGFHYFVPETAPEHCDEEQAKARNYGVFSARFGNIYTVRQLLQLIERVEGIYSPRDAAWTSRGQDGRLVDPFRPQIEPAGFIDEASLLADRDQHFAAVRTMLREMDVFIFTLGLTEGWRSRGDGAVFPLAPGVAGGQMDSDKYEFINFDVDSIRSDLHQVIAQLRRINPSCRIILTVSPVPLIATYEERHALVATTYSKSVLRVVADEMWRQYSHVDYFPSYEIITGSYNHGQYYADDLREVQENGVAHVMRVFMKHYAASDGDIAMPQEAAVSNEAAPEARARNPLFEIICDEEAIANF